MKQKTEASQAVDEHKPCPFCGTAPRYLAKQEGIYCELVICDTCGLGLAPSSWNRRAALKVQPAPTEAANFCARCGKRLHAGSIHTCTPPAYAETPAHECIARENDTLVCTACGTTSPIEWVVLNPTEAAQAGAGLTRENPQTRMDATFDAGAGLAEQGALSANPNLTTSAVTCQPVAAQGNTSNNSSSSQLSGNSGELQPSGNTGELVQLEDSARLADGYKSSTMVSDFYGPKVTLHYETTAQADAAHDTLVSMIERASAETGGVNVQPPYPEGDVVGACVCGSWPGGKCLKCPWIPAETGGVKS